MIIRRLVPEDLNQVDRLKISAPKYLGIDSSIQNSQLRFSQPAFIRYLDPNDPLCFAFGAFNDDLVSFTTGRFDHDNPHWFLQIILSSQNRADVKMNGLVDCLTETVKYAESKNCLTYWYSIPSKYKKSHRTIWSSSSEVLAQYIREDYMEVPAFTRCPDQKLHVGVLSELVFPIDMTIRKVYRD
jgi:hypothetical protein